MYWILDFSRNSSTIFLNFLKVLLWLFSWSCSVQFEVVQFINFFSLEWLELSLTIRPPDFFSPFISVSFKKLITFFVKFKAHAMVKTHVSSNVFPVIQPCNLDPRAFYHLMMYVSKPSHARQKQPLEVLYKKDVL